MNLEPERVITVARFLEAYARTALVELEGLGVKTDTVSLDQAPPEASSAFITAADAASALREAGQWMLYLDTDRSRQLLAWSGRLFHSMGYAFGTYLLVVAGDWAEDPPFSVFGGSLAGFNTNRNNHEPPAALQHPQQQVYLLLASGGSAPIAREFRSRLAGILETSMHREGVTPVGALGTPIRRLWGVARHLVLAEPDAPVRIAQHLAAMCERYDETMKLAQTNTYLWRHGAAPVDVGDIDIAGIAAVAARRFSGDAMLQAFEELDSHARLSPVAFATVEAGIALSEPWRTDSRSDGDDQ